MKRIVITGASGVIGSVLEKSLPRSGIGVLTRLDDTAFQADETLADALHGQEVVIHLAWIRVMGPPRAGVRYSELLPDDNRHHESLKLAERVLEASQRAGVKRAILASSVHADDFYTWAGPGLLGTERVPRPAGPYGAAKVLLEEQGRFHAGRGLEVVCVRFGAVTAGDLPHPTNLWEQRVWLSHGDCAAMIRACIEASTVPERFCVFYAVSDNEGRVHDTRNPFDWRPSVRSREERSERTSTNDSVALGFDQRRSTHSNVTEVCSRVIQDRVAMEVYWLSVLEGTGPAASLYVHHDEVMRLDCLGPDAGHMHVNMIQSARHPKGAKKRLYFCERTVEEQIERAVFELTTNAPYSLGLNEDPSVQQTFLDPQKLVDAAEWMRHKMKDLLGKKR